MEKIRCCDPPHATSNTKASHRCHRPEAATGKIRSDLLAISCCDAGFPQHLDFRGLGFTVQSSLGQEVINLWGRLCTCPPDSADAPCATRTQRASWPQPIGTSRPPDESHRSSKDVCHLQCLQRTNIAVRRRPCRPETACIPD